MKYLHIRGHNVILFTEVGRQPFFHRDHYCVATVQMHSAYATYNSANILKMERFVCKWPCQLKPTRFIYIPLYFQYLLFKYCTLMKLFKYFIN